MQFRKLNNLTGWIVFTIALVTYLLTIEPTASLWDCAEFIATSYKLEVGHPPGTPFFFLINRLGAMFAPSITSIAMIINGLSALESAFTILFLFWSISHLGRRIYNKRAEELSTDQSWAVLGAAAVGALAYTFSDTFWFSAVEAEVYALSSLFTAIIFWAILKWEEVADQPGSNRWLILIAYLMGLSIGAHILNLLAIPAIVLIYYFKRYPGRKALDLWKPLLVAVIILGGMIKITPLVASIGAFVDRVFVNSLGLPVNSGITFFIILLLIAIGFGVWYSHKAARATLNTILLSLGMVVIGLSTYGIVLIRASANPPMNSNNPSNPYALKDFINREQYGAPPLLMGESFASVPIDNNFQTKYLLDENGKYTSYESLLDYEFDPNTTMFFPRMYSTNADHVKEYKNWVDFKGKPVMTESGEVVTVPTFGENLSFFFGYQVSHMYWRYFLWNFVGRQTDVQNDGILNGNWLSGIDFIDQAYLGPQDNLPSELADNKGRNRYFFLPFILGMIGLFFHLTRDGRNFTVVMVLFLMTGLAIILYLNQTPNQPRERDYAYAGSFYAFAIWIGLGVLPIFELLRDKIKIPGKTAALSAIILTATVPTIMAVQNWDDHDYSGRTIVPDMGHNYLNTLEPNAVLFVHGDNDTFATWYAQEVEEYRTDVRPLNTQYIYGGWYIDQMRVKSNKSEALPIKLPRSKYTGEASFDFPIFEIDHPHKRDWTIREVMDFIYSDHPATKTEYGKDFIPARRIAVPVNKENAIRSGIVKEADAHLMVDTLYLNLEDKRLTISEIIAMDIIANNNWERPLYSTSSSNPWKKLGILVANKEEQYCYLQENGNATLLIPIKTPFDDLYAIGRIDVDILYKHLMVDARFGNTADPKTYICSFFDYTLNSGNFRSNFARLANELTLKGKSEDAIKVVDKVMAELPLEKFRITRDVAYLIGSYWRAGADEKGDSLAQEFIRINVEYLDYFTSFDSYQVESLVMPTYIRIDHLYTLFIEAREYGKYAICDEILPYIEDYLK